ncbi:MAG: glycosyltransferase [Candidatus Eisenbacteria bacterium]|nr:glycosyltransferase [Candidatus Eisenbacteria bacterium]
MTLEIVLIALLTVYLAASFLLHLYGINAYIMIGLFLRTQRRRRREDRELLQRFYEDHGDADLPVVTTQLPVFNERHVLERLVRAVCAFDYPREKHEIQILDDSTDETRELAGRLAARLRARGHDVRHIHREDRTGFKAGALAEGLRRARGEFVAVFDADFVPPADFLRRTIPFLLEDARCGFVQTRWGHRNRGFSALTFLQSVGIDGHFAVEQPARCWNGLFFNFNGTAGVWRRQAIDEAGGWEADTLTEDLDLSYRTQLAGWQPRYLLDVVTPAEIPTDINALKSQQYRWAKGSIQAAVKLLPVVWKRRDMGVFKRVQATLHLTHYLVHPLILLITLLILPLIFLFHVQFTSVYVAPLIVGMFLALFGPSTLYIFSQGVSGQRWPLLLLWLPAMMALGIGLAVNNTRAVLSGLSGRQSEFVRTPKLGQLAESKVRGVAGPLRSLYRQPVSRLFLVEIFMGLWALAAFLGGFHIIGAVAGPFLLVQAAGFTYVGIASVVHERGGRKLGI